jgi:hypothetical protein
MEEADVRADQVLDRVEHRGMADDLADPGEEEVRLEVEALADSAPTSASDSSRRARYRAASSWLKASTGKTNPSRSYYSTGWRQ